MKRNFRELLEAKWDEGKFVCVGLDTDYDVISEYYSDLFDSEEGPTVRSFNRSIVESTHDLVCAYKPNIAFYEALGLYGLRVKANHRRYSQDCSKRTSRFGLQTG